MKIVAFVLALISFYILANKIESFVRHNDERISEKARSIYSNYQYIEYEMTFDIAWIISMAVVFLGCLTIIF